MKFHERSKAITVDAPPADVWCSHAFGVFEQQVLGESGGRAKWAAQLHGVVAYAVLKGRRNSEQTGSLVLGIGGRSAGGEKIVQRAERGVIRLGECIRMVADASGNAVAASSAAAGDTPVEVG